MPPRDASRPRTSPVRYSIRAGEESVPSCGPIQACVSHLEPKVNRSRTTAGVLTLAEYNRRAREFTPQLCSEKYRFLCETWTKYNHHTPLANELYELEQRESRTLRGKGARVVLPGSRRSPVDLPVM